MRLSGKKTICISAAVPILLLGLLGCMRQDDWKIPVQDCARELSPNTTLQNVLGSYTGATKQIRDEWVIEAYVISSDESGNFFNTLHLQDKPSEPGAGVQVEVDFRDSYLFYPPGQRVLLHLEGLYLGKSRGIFKLGSGYSSFGNLQVGRIPKHAIRDHIIKGCELPVSLAPKTISVPDLPVQPPNTLVRLEDMEFAAELRDSAFAQKEVQTPRSLLDCQDNEINLTTSGYSDFFDETLPAGKGSITAIYHPEGGEGKLVIRSPDDLDFSGERCEDLITEFTSPFIFITELADPDNNSAARFVELYYAGDQPLSLNGWHLDRYTNDNTERGSSISLSNFTVAPGQFLLIASDALVFEQTYGIAPDLEGGPNSPADSNGDDNLVLVDPFGTIIDIFGLIGEDGSGTAHEFEDGRAKRRIEIQGANPVFTPSEWEIFNDSGASGTINQPQNAPQDFSPGSRD